VDYNLDPLNLDETHSYIRHRLQVAGGKPDLFDAAACELVYRHSGGTPRLINLLCDTALVYGYAEQVTQIHAPLVNDVVQEKLKGGIFPRVQPATTTDTPLRTAWPKPAEENTSHGDGKKYFA